MTVSRRTFLLAAGSATLAACTHAAHRAATRRPPVRAPRATTTSPTAPETTTPPPGSAARFIRSGPTSANVVALTFHGSGDIALATELLDAARAGGAALTIFAVGRWLDENPDMARRVLDAGHELANHTYTHPALGGLGASRHLRRRRMRPRPHARTRLGVVTAGGEHEREHRHDHPCAIRGRPHRSRS